MAVNSIFSKGVLMMYIAGFTQKYPWTPASWIGIWHQQHKQKPPHPPSLQKLFKTYLYSHFQSPINTCLSIKIVMMTSPRHIRPFSFNKGWSHTIWTMAAPRKPEILELACLATRAVKAFCRRVLLNCFSTWCGSGWKGGCVDHYHYISKQFHWDF